MSIFETLFVNVLLYIHECVSHLADGGMGFFCAGSWSPLACPVMWCTGMDG